MNRAIAIRGRYPNEIAENRSARRPCSRSRVVITHVAHFPSFISARPDVESALGPEPSEEEEEKEDGGRRDL